MQVIFLPSGSGPSRSFRFRVLLVCSIAAGMLLAIGAGGGYVGFQIGTWVTGNGTSGAGVPGGEERPRTAIVEKQEIPWSSIAVAKTPVRPETLVASAGSGNAGALARIESPAAAGAREKHETGPESVDVADNDRTTVGQETGAPTEIAASRPAASGSEPATQRDIAGGPLPGPLTMIYPGDPRRGDGPVDEPATVSIRSLVAVKAALEEQQLALEESRRRLGDHFDGLGQRLGQVQAHVSRLNALGQRLTDMAGLDRAEFSFDNPPALGGPDRHGPWERIQEPRFGESLDSIEAALRQKENELSILEALLTDRKLHEKQYPQGWPTAGGGWMSSAFGYRNDPFSGRKAFHEGVDIAARSGSEIRAMAAGVVSYSARKPGYGLVVEINHGNGYETRYAHAKELIAKTGDRVEKGDTVALVGSTGRSTGSHVHIEVLKNGKPINPRDHLSASR